MTFRDEYRKYNDSVHAPKSILESIKEKASDETTEEQTPLFEERPRRRWISVVTYSGVAAAAAVLVLLIVNPFQRTAKSSQPVLTADTAETLALGSSLTAGALMEADTASVPESAVLSFAAPNSEAKVSSYMEDGEPEELFPAYVEELTYHDIYSWLAPSVGEEAVDNSASRSSAPVLLTRESGARISGQQIIVGDSSIELPDGRIPLALADLSGKVLAVSESEGYVFVTEITVADGMLSISNEASQSGSFVSCSIHDSNIFEEDVLVTYPVFEVMTTYSINTADASESDPSTFCPVISDPSGTRPLEPGEISIYDSGSTYTVYTGYECGSDLRVLYTFAELGLD